MPLNGATYPVGSLDPDSGGIHICGLDPDSGKDAMHRVSTVRVSRQGNHINRKNMRRHRIKPRMGFHMMNLLRRFVGAFRIDSIDMNALPGKACTECFDRLSMLFPRREMRPILLPTVL
jgi:hypothetical protein